MVKKIRLATSTTEDDGYMPDEITEGILIRLPIKSVLRFKAVCNSWHHVICSPYFKNNYLEYSSKTPQLLLRPDDYNPSIYVWSHDSIKSDRNLQGDDAFVVHPSKLPNPLPSINRVLPNSIVGTCNGLVCLNYSSDFFVLWNPITNELNQLPEYPRERWMTPGGFGYDSVHDDYKVVIIAISDGEEPRPVFLFSRSTNSWKYLESFNRHIWRLRSAGWGKYFNGALHWMAIEASTLDGIIVALDLATETFRYDIRLPYHKDSQSLWHCPHGELCVLDDCLCALDFINTRECAFQVWIMKEYGNQKSWTKVLASTTSCTPSWNFEGRLGGGIQHRGWKVVSYEDFNCKGTRRTKLCYLREDPYAECFGQRHDIDYRDDYVPSFVSPLCPHLASVED